MTPRERALQSGGLEPGLYSESRAPGQAVLRLLAAEIGILSAMGRVLSEGAFLWYFPSREAGYRFCSVKEGSMGQFDRITQDPGVMGGKACIRGMRVTVGMIVSQIGAGHTVDELLAGYPYLEREDILQALRYAARLADEREVLLAGE